MERCSSKLFQPLHRLKIASALAIAASNSRSLPGLTSIWEISVIMAAVASVAGGTMALAQKQAGLKRRGPLSPRYVLAEQNDKAHHHQAAVEKQQHRPVGPRPVVTALRATLGDQSGFIFVGAGE